MKELSSLELSRQLKKPSGKIGHEVAKRLNHSNKTLYDLAFSMLDLKPKEHLLEIGFGNGNHFSHYFDLQPEVRVTGVDFSVDMCEEAEKDNSKLIKDHQLTIHCADASGIPIQDSTVDIIISLNVVYFWDPIVGYLQELRRVLKPGGQLLLGYRPRKIVEHLEFTKQNFILYDPSELNLLMQQNGFKHLLEEQNNYKKESPDGTDIEITDICMLCEN